MTPMIVCVDDQRDVLSALRKDLTSLEKYFEIVISESADEAQELLEEADQTGQPIALVVCDHIMPGKNGVSFLGDLNKDSRFSKVRKILLTGLATHQDTIHAINQANLDCYIEKPWNIDKLLADVKRLLTLFVLDAGIDYKAFLPVLDQQTLYSKLRG